MNIWGWIFVLLTVLLAIYGLRRLASQLELRISLGLVPASARLPILGFGMLVAVFGVGVALVIGSWLAAGIR